MFERFTMTARAVVVDAQAHARRLGAPMVGTEHLLLALLSAPGPGSEALLRAGLDEAGIDTNLRRAYGGVADDEDRAALASLGIDLDRVMEAAESAFGPDALCRARCRTPRRRRFSRRWRRHCRPVCHQPRGHLRFSPRAKSALELSLREAVRLHHRHITAEHLALGVLREGQGLACRVIAELGVDLMDLRASLEESARHAA